jgi:hypothetical protein
MTARTCCWLIALLFAAGIVSQCVADAPAKTTHPTTSPAASVSVPSAPKPDSPAAVSGQGPQRPSDLDPTAKAADDDRKAQIKAIDEKIKLIRDQFKSQADPLQAQLKALRDKLDADLKPLQEQRKALVEQGESPALVALNEEETSQLASLAEREKAEIEKLKQNYDDQKKTIEQEFQNRRQALRKK